MAPKKPSNRLVISCVCSLVMLVVSGTASASSWSTGPNLPGPQPTGSTSTLLPDGRILVVGGLVGPDVQGSAPLNTVFLIDPAKGTAQALPVLTTNRGRHTATLLQSGEVLFTGGIITPDVDFVSNTAVLFDPETQTWRSAADMDASRADHTATLLGSGKVLIAGGCTQKDCSSVTSFAEVYDPARDIFDSVVNQLFEGRYLHTATLLPNGAVLIAGGANPDGFPTTTADIYNTPTNTMLIEDQMSRARMGHSATLLGSGSPASAKVLMVGGDPLTPGRDTAQLYAFMSPSPWGPIFYLDSGDHHYRHGAALLTSNEVLIVGGCSQFDPGIPCDCGLPPFPCHDDAWLLDPVNTTVSLLNSAPDEIPIGVATALPDGRVLVVGNYNSGTSVFHRTYSKTTPLATMNSGRIGHAAQSLSGGRVVVVGSSVDVFVPPNPWTSNGGTWTGGGTLPTVRDNRSVVLVPGSDTVMVVGGSAIQLEADLIEIGSGGASTISAAPGLMPGRGRATATASGEVLFVSGGSDTTRLYTPGSGWTEGVLLNEPRTTEDFGLVLLHSGEVMVIGGITSCGACTEIYNPADHTTRIGLDYGGQWLDSTATVLSSGEVLVVDLTGAYLWNPGAETWSSTGSPASPRSGHSATALPSGLVLIAGGNDGARTQLCNAEIYDRLSGSFASLGSQYCGDGLASALLADGRVLHTGGGVTATAAAAADVEGVIETGRLRPSFVSVLPQWLLNATELFVDDFNTASPAGSIDRAGLFTKRGNSNGLSGVLVASSGYAIVTTPTAQITETEHPITGMVSQVPFDPGLNPLDSEDGFSLTWKIQSADQPIGHGIWLTGQTGTGEIFDPSDSVWYTGRPQIGFKVGAGGVGRVDMMVYLAASSSTYSSQTGLAITWPATFEVNLFVTASGWSYTIDGLDGSNLLTDNGIWPVAVYDELFSANIYPGAFIQGNKNDFSPRALAVDTIRADKTGLAVTALGLAGDSEASSGSNLNSAANVPSFSLRSLSTGTVRVLSLDSGPVECQGGIGNCQAQEATVRFSQLPVGLARGDHHLTAFTSGISSHSVDVEVACPLEIQDGPSLAPVAVGASATMWVDSSDGRFFQWQACVGTDIQCPAVSDSQVADLWADIAGEVGPQYTTEPLTAADSGTRFRVLVDAGCSSGSSGVFTVTVEDFTSPTALMISPSGGEFWVLSAPEPDPPNQEVITWAMSDDVRLCHVVVDLICSTDGGLNWVDAPAGGGLPAVIGSPGACTFPGVDTTSTIYTLPTTAPCAGGALYQARVVVADHAGNQVSATSDDSFYIVEPNPGAVDTIILTYLERMESIQGLSTTQTATLTTRLHELAEHPLVQGNVIDVGPVPAIAALYSAWDTSGLDPDVGNDVLFAVGGIHDYLIDEVLLAFPNARYLVIVGDDRIIPFARLVDGGALLTEDKYTLSGLDLTATETSVGKALSAGLYLSDDPLAVLDSVRPGELDGSTLFTADLAVGRLVETPEEIITTIATFFSQEGGLDLTGLDPVNDHWALITGYDFLIDSATTVAERWKNHLGAAVTDTAATAPVDASLNSVDWGLPNAGARAAEMLQHVQGLHDSPPGDPYRVVNFNGHATHHQIGVPGEQVFDIQGLDATALIGVNLAGGIAYGVGCHAGLSVGAAATTSEPFPLDLPQVLLGQGVVAYAANSGYGWGLVNGIGYGERLVQILTEELTTGGDVTIGEAMRQTKLRYVLEAPSLDAYDDKSLMQWTIFGLPMYTIRTSAGARTAAPFSGPSPEIDTLSERLELGDVVVHRRIEDGGERDLPNYLTQLSLTFDLSAQGVYNKHTSSGTTVSGSPGCPDVDGCYYTLNGLVERSSGATDLPLQPYLIYDSRLSGTSQHGVLWLGGDYTEESGWVAVIAELVSNAGGGGDHGAAAKYSRGRPSGKRALDGPEPNDCRPVDYEFNSVVLTTGDAVGDGFGTYDRERLYSAVDLEVFYYNNTATSIDNCDRIGPVIGAAPVDGEYHSTFGDELLFRVPSVDPAGVWRVVVVFNDEALDAWVPLDLVEDSGNSGEWIGSLDMMGRAVSVYLIQAVDNHGNVSYVPFETTDIPSSGVVKDVPDTIDQPFLFLDDFEMGHTSRWTSTTP